MNRIIASNIFLLVSGAAFASESGEHVTRQLTGGSSTINAGGPVIEKVNTSGIYNYREVVYEHIKSYQSGTQNPQGSARVTFGEDIHQKKQDIIKARIAAANQAQQVNVEKSKLPQWPRFAEGYCYVKNDVEVEKIATYAYLSCDFITPVGRGELVVSLVPDFYANALIAKPLYLNILGKDRKKQRVPVASGAILTQNKLSVNIANVVNDRKIERLMASGTYTTLNTATQQAQVYLNDVRASRIKETATTNSNAIGASTVVTKNTNAPIAADYLLAGTLQVVSNLAKIIGESVVESLPYTFKINKDSILYADVELSESASLRGFDADLSTGIIRKQPKFDITKGTNEDMDTLSVPVRK